MVTKLIFLNVYLNIYVRLNFLYTNTSSFNSYTYMHLYVCMRCYQRFLADLRILNEDESFHLPIPLESQPCL